MCIEKTESFRFAGKLYETEKDAIEAALSEIGSKIVKEHHANPAKGLLTHADDLVPLLTRLEEIHNG